MRKIIWVCFMGAAWAASGEGDEREQARAFALAHMQALQAGDAQAVARGVYRRDWLLAAGGDEATLAACLARDIEAWRVPPGEMRIVNEEIGCDSGNADMLLASADGRVHQALSLEREGQVWRAAPPLAVFGLCPEMLAAPSVAWMTPLLAEAQAQQMTSVWLVEPPQEAGGFAYVSLSGAGSDDAGRAAIRVLRYRLQENAGAWQAEPCDMDCYFGER